MSLRVTSSWRTEASHRAAQRERAVTMVLAGVGCLAVLGVMAVSRVTSEESSGAELWNGGLLGEHVGERRWEPVWGRGCRSYTCQNGGTCVMRREKPVCLCKAGFIGHKCQDMRLELTCDGAGMRLQLLKSVLAELGVEPSEVHTAGHNCSLQDWSDLHASITLTGHNHTLCGTLVKVNGTHLIYSSQLTTDLVSERPESPADAISRSPDVLLSFSCVYPYDGVVSLPFPLLAVSSLVTFVVKEGAFNVMMTLHPTAQFLEPYDRPPVIPVSGRLYVQLQILGVAPQEHFMLKLEECWATPTPNHEPNIRHLILSEGLEGDPTVEWIQSNRTLSRFSFKMFHFVKFPEVFLHCRIWLCQPRASHDCHQRGAGRAVRELGEQYRKVVSCGPIRVPRGVASGVEQPQPGPRLFVFSASFAAGAILLLLTVVTIAKILEKKGPKAPPPLNE